MHRVGLGCMAFTGIYGPISRSRAIRIIQRALDLGVTHFDTAELYGPYLNEELLAEALGPAEASVEIATKFGYRLQGGKIVGLDSTPPSIRSAVEGSLRRLRRDHVDVLYQHRPDPSVPIEDVVGTMSDLVNEGKVLSLGLSATDPKSLQRARAVHPISFIQNEFSLIQRDPERDLLRTAAETSSAFVCYSPLGRGILAGGMETRKQHPTSDYRTKDVRFQPGRLAEITDLLSPLWKISADRGTSSAAISLAWLLSKAPSVRVIPGATSEEQLDANLHSCAITLTTEEVQVLDQIDAR